MPNALSNVLSGAKYALSQPEDDQSNAGNPASVAAPATAVPVSKPAPQPTPKGTPTSASEKLAPVQKADNDFNPLAASKPNPKRIAFPSGMVLETPGDWADGVVNTMSRELHSAASTVLGLPSAIYHAAADEETPEESARFGKGFEKKIGPTGRVIDRTSVQPLINAFQDYRDGKVSWDGVLSVLPEAIGGAGGAVVTGKAASEAAKLGSKALQTPTEKPVSAPLNEDNDFGASQKKGATSDYNKPMPKDVEGSDRIGWLNRNISDEAKLDTARHELAHYNYAAKAGHPTSDMFFTVGHEEVPGGGFSQGRVGTLDSFWRQLMKNAKTPEARVDATTKYLKQLYAPTVIEEMQGASPEDIDYSTQNDQLQAEKFMEKKMGLKPDEVETVKGKILDQLRKEITPQEFDRYTHAARQITGNHYGQFVSPWAIDHYLSGGTHDTIAEKLATEDAEFNNPTGPGKSGVDNMLSNLFGGK